MRRALPGLAAALLAVFGLAPAPAQARPDTIESHAGLFVLDLRVDPGPARVVQVLPTLVDGAAGTALGGRLTEAFVDALRRHEPYRVQLPPGAADGPAVDGFLQLTAERIDCASTLTVRMTRSDAGGARPVGLTRELDLRRIDRRLHPPAWRACRDAEGEQALGIHRARPAREAREPTPWIDVTVLLVGGPLVIGFGLWGKVSGADTRITGHGAGWPAMAHRFLDPGPLSRLVRADGAPGAELGVEFAVGTLRVGARWMLLGAGGGETFVPGDSGDPGFRARALSSRAAFFDLGFTRSIPGTRRAVRPWVSGRVGVVETTVSADLSGVLPVDATGKEASAAFTTCRASDCGWAYVVTGPAFGLQAGIDLRTPGPSLHVPRLVLRPHALFLLGSHGFSVGLGVSGAAHFGLPPAR